MGTLVVSVDRNGDIASAADIEGPVVGWDAVEALVTDVGLTDPEDSAVNSLLEALRVTRDLEADGESSTVAVVSGGADTRVGADRSVARQMDQLVSEHDPESVVVVIDSAEDERLVPIIESRVPVDSVDRVVVRQAHDLESTYYLLKQFLADEELRGTILVPIGATLLIFPIITLFFSTAVAVATITAVIGGFLLYKGLGLDEYVEDLPTQARDALYSGQVSIVTYVVAAGLALIGTFAGALGASGLGTGALLLSSMAFVFHSVPWLALSALVASTGRLFDEFVRTDRLRASYMNLPFGVVATGIVVRGFAAYFLQRAEVIPALLAPRLRIGAFSVAPFPLTAEERLATFVVVGVLISLVGVRIASFVSGAALAEADPVE